MANIDWTTALIGAAVGWVASTKVGAAQDKFAATIAAGSASGVKAAWKAQLKKAKKKAGKAGKASKAGKSGKSGTTN